MPICNTRYVGIHVSDQYLGQLSDGLDQMAAEYIAQNFKETPAQEIEHCVRKYGLARTKNVLDRWTLWLWQPDFLYEMPYQPLEPPAVLLGELQHGYLIRLEEDLSNQALEMVKSLEYRMDDELKEFCRALSGKQPQEIMENAQRLGFYNELKEYVQDWQGILFKDELESTELEQLDYLGSLLYPLQEIYELIGKKLSFFEVMDNAISKVLDSVLNEIKVTAIEENMINGMVVTHDE